MSERICPNPMPWNEAYQRLLDHANEHGCDPPDPPKPLILAGWNFSNDVEKRERWDSTVAWAEANECAELIVIPDEDFYFAESPTSYTVGPMGGPMYRPWNYDEKDRPSDKEAADLMRSLRESWPVVAGEELSKVTWPSRFSGAKLRCLVVRALSSASPPWGDWHQLSQVEQHRRQFTNFRSAINAAVIPHEVDHVTFEVVDDAELRR